MAVQVGAVQVGAVQQVSAGGIRAWRSCRRYWGFQYLAGLRGEQTEAQSFGLAVEAQLQRYLTDGTLDIETREGQIALAGLEYLPRQVAQSAAPGPVFQDHLECEYDGVQYHGYTDCYWVDTTGPVWVIRLVDFKTTRDLVWAKTVDELLVDEQCTLYRWMLQEIYGLPVVAHWLYLEKGAKPRSRWMTIAESPETVDRRMAELHRSGLEIQAARGARLEDLPRNFDACGNYRGCPFTSLFRALRPTEPPRTLPECLDPPVAPSGEATDGVSGLDNNVSPADRIRATLRAYYQREWRADLVRDQTVTYYQEVEMSVSPPTGNTQQQSVAERVKARMAVLAAGAAPAIAAQVAAPAIAAPAAPAIAAPAAPAIAAPPPAIAAPPPAIAAPVVAQFAPPAPAIAAPEPILPPDPMPARRGPGRPRKDGAAPVPSGYSLHPTDDGALDNFAALATILGALRGMSVDTAMGVLMAAEASVEALAKSIPPF